MRLRENIKEKKRIVIKVGSSTITYPETGNINLDKLEKFVRILIHLLNQGKEVIVVSSGSIAIGRKKLKLERKELSDAEKKACAAVGQGRLMMIYEKLFSEYGYLTAQMLLTKESIMDVQCRSNAKAAFEELIALQVVPIVNENDAIAVSEELYGMFGDNDTMAAQVSELVEADLLILMSDIDGLYTDDPRKNENARFVHTVVRVDDELERMGKGAGTSSGTGGMRTKIEAAKIAMKAGCDMVIANGNNIHTINDIMNGGKVGTLFLANQDHVITENELSD